jgi:hypothetical protein
MASPAGGGRAPARELRMSIEEVAKKLTLWHTATFRPILTHDELEPILTAAGFVPLPPLASGERDRRPPPAVAWREYAFLGAAAVAGPPAAPAVPARRRAPPQDVRGLPRRPPRRRPLPRQVCCGRLASSCCCTLACLHRLRIHVAVVAAPLRTNMGTHPVSRLRPGFFDRIRSLGGTGWDLQRPLRIRSCAAICSYS